MTMGQRIGEQRKKLGISQEALGEKLDVSRQAVSKWESDGAVPDVDKLITMSKLFGVSVGWLLGVEEESAPERSEELTEKQLRMIEEIVKRYQPEPTVVTQTVVKKEGKGFKVLAGFGIALAVILAIIALNKIQKLPDYNHQLNNISTNYHNVQSQLGVLSQQLDDLAKGEQLLTEYSCVAKGFPDLSGAEITFRATPRQWQDGDIGLLVARLDGEEVTTAQCSFSGSGYTAVLELPPADGYSYCFVQCHADGSREQQILEDVDHYCVYVAEGLRINCQGDVSWHEDVVKQPGKVNLYPDSCQIYMHPPTIVNWEDDLTWEYAQLVFLRSGEELRRYDLLKQENMFMEPAVSGWYLDTAFWIEDLVIPMQDQDRVSVMLEARLSNGMELSKEITAWHLEGTQIVADAPLDQFQ